MIAPMRPSVAPISDNRSVFMIFTAYLDESGTHASAPISAMGGFVGDARQWRKFEKRAGKLFKRFRVDIFHAIDADKRDYTAF